MLEMTAKNLITKYGTEIDIYSYGWVIDSIAANIILPASFSYLHHISDETLKKLSQSQDVFADSFVMDATLETLKFSMNRVGQLFPSLFEKSNQSFCLHSTLKAIDQTRVSLDQKGREVAKEFLLNSNSEILFKILHDRNEPILKLYSMFDSAAQTRIGALHYSMFKEFVFYFDVYDSFTGGIRVSTAATVLDVTESIARNYKAQVIPVLTSSVTHIIVARDESALRTRLLDLQAACHRGAFEIRLVTVDWILQCVDGKKILDELPFYPRQSEKEKRFFGKQPMIK